jgi:hypothetical protein
MQMKAVDAVLQRVVVAVVFALLAKSAKNVDGM